MQTLGHKPTAQAHLEILEIIMIVLDENARNQLDDPLLGQRTENHDLVHRVGIAIGFPKLWNGTVR